VRLLVRLAGAWSCTCACACAYGKSLLTVLCLICTYPHRLLQLVYSSLCIHRRELHIREDERHGRQMLDEVAVPLMHM
jgi:hypothetical protein